MAWAPGLVLSPLRLLRSSGPSALSALLPSSDPQKDEEAEETDAQVVRPRCPAQPVPLPLSPFDDRFDELIDKIEKAITVLGLRVESLWSGVSTVVYTIWGWRSMLGGLCLRSKIQDTWSYGFRI